VKHNYAFVETYSHENHEGDAKSRVITSLLANAVSVADQLSDEDIFEIASDDSIRIALVIS
jgi:hypothetical protein